VTRHEQNLQLAPTPVGVGRRSDGLEAGWGARPPGGGAGKGPGRGQP
jgi:hypothetical protein